MIEFDALSISYRRGAHLHPALRDFSVEVGAGEALALVGESGSGKTTAARGVLGDIGVSGSVTGGTVRVDGREVFALSDVDLQHLRRRVVGYVPQNPGASLNPVRRVGRQIAEMVSGSGVDKQVAELLRRVQLDPSLARRYPHQLSGGQQQRVGLAIALANDPKVLVLDEPTTGLDVGVQAEVLRLFRGLVDDGLAVLYVTHDLGAAAVVADRVAVLYAGDIVENGTLADVFARPRHPYTEALLGAVPSVSSRATLAGIPGVMLSSEERDGCCVFHNRCRYAVDVCRAQRPPLEALAGRHVRCFLESELRLKGVAARSDDGRVGAEEARSNLRQEAVISVAELSVQYGWTPKGTPIAVDGVTLDIARGETVALVGESGSGKTSLARAIAGLVKPISGEARLDEKRLPSSYRQRSPEQLRRIQYVFQNSTLALNPRQSIRSTLEAPLRQFFDLSSAQEDERVAELMEMVGLPKRLLAQRPKQLSGGEQQRVAIARALAAKPDVMICDEIVSALDVSVQAAIVGLLGDLQRETGVAMLFISHDLGVVRAIADRTAVMKSGRLVESAVTRQIFEHPTSDYTKMLLQSVPDAAAVLTSTLA